MNSLALYRVATCDPGDAFPMAHGMQLCLVTWYSTAASHLGERQRSWVRLWRDKSLNFSSLPPLYGWPGESRIPPWQPWSLPCPDSMSFTSTVHRGPVAVMCFWKFRGRWKIRWKFSLGFGAQPAGHSVNLEGLCSCQQDGSADSPLLWG